MNGKFKIVLMFINCSRQSLATRTLQIVSFKIVVPVLCVKLHCLVSNDVASVASDFCIT